MVKKRAFCFILCYLYHKDLEQCFLQVDVKDDYIRKIINNYNLEFSKALFPKPSTKQEGRIQCAFRVILRNTLHNLPLNISLVFWLGILLIILP